MRSHFARQGDDLWRTMKRNLVFGLRCLFVGSISFIILILASAALNQFNACNNSSLNDLDEILLLLGYMIGVGAWVVIWKPCDIILFGWWYENQERRVYNSLAKMNVRLSFDAQHRSMSNFQLPS